MGNLIESPVLFLVFNRPEKTQRVFDVIKSVKPKKLYVAADAPRENNPQDKINCEKVRNIVSQINWDCNAKFLFQEKNLGCSLAGKTAWDWLFSQEEEMIMIEDDGLVSKTFFWFCDEMLKKYKNDPRIGYICGTNFGPKYGDFTYFFSRFGGGTISMGTWKRVHDLYDYKLETYKMVRNKTEFKRNFINHFAYKFEISKFDNFIKNGGNTYDLQMTFLLYKYNMLTILPNVNLVSLIGYDLDGTNTAVSPLSKMALKFGNRPRIEFDKIYHPDKVYVDEKFERKYYKFRVLNDESWVSAIYKFYNFRYGYPACKKIVKQILYYFKVMP